MRVVEDAQVQSRPGVCHIPSRAPIRRSAIKAPMIQFLLWLWSPVAAILDSFNNSGLGSSCLQTHSKNEIEVL